MREQPLKEKGKRARRAEMASDDYARAMDAALRLLSFRPRTGGEIEQRLRQKEFTEAVVKRVRERLEEIGYIDDREFALSWIKAHSGVKCRSARLLKRDLDLKGVDADVAERVIEENYREEEVLRAACELARGRIARSSVKDTVKLKKRLQSLLLRRGFDYDFIRSVFERIKVGS